MDEKKNVPGQSDAPLAIETLIEMAIAAGTKKVESEEDWGWYSVAMITGTATMFGDHHVAGDEE